MLQKVTQKLQQSLSDIQKVGESSPAAANPAEDSRHSTDEKAS